MIVTTDSNGLTLSIHCITSWIIALILTAFNSDVTVAMGMFLGFSTAALFVYALYCMIISGILLATNLKR